MDKKTHILFFHLGASSFVREDLRILNEHVSVDEFYFPPQKGTNKVLSGMRILMIMIHQLAWILLRLHKTDAFYCWFADYHGVVPALVSRITGLPMLTVLGGVDCVIMKELNYGILQDPSRKSLGKLVLKNSSLLLPVTRTLIESDPIAKDWPEAHPNGLLAHFPDLKTPYEILPTGYDPDFWESGAPERKKIVSTVAVMNTHQRVLVKGLDLFLECAGQLPDFEFRVVGLNPELEGELRSRYTVGENVRFYPRIPIQDLKAIYAESSVYAQLSRTEGLPNVLCEAMLCGCIPVGSAVFGIPEAINDCGFVAARPDPAEITGLIIKAHDQDGDRREKARQHIIRYYSRELREKKLIAILSKQIAGN